MTVKELSTHEMAEHQGESVEKFYGYYKRLQLADSDLAVKIPWPFRDHCTWPRESYAKTPVYFNLGFYTEHNTGLWQTREEEIDGIDTRWIKKQIPVLSHTIAFIKLDPGNTQPWHVDFFYLLKSKAQDGSEPNLRPVRYLVFLQDWRLGQFVQIEEHVVAKWRAGDCWYFCDRTWHMATNGGLEPLVACQVSGFVPDNRKV